MKWRRTPARSGIGSSVSWSIHLGQELGDPASPALVAVPAVAAAPSAELGEDAPKRLDAGRQRIAVVLDRVGKQLSERIFDPSGTACAATGAVRASIPATADPRVLNCRSPSHTARLR